MSIYGPRYEHYCTECFFLGQHENFDLYYCEQGRKRPTVLAVYEEEDEVRDLSGSAKRVQYVSGLSSEFPALDVARTLARTMGLLK